MVLITENIAHIFVRIMTSQIAKFMGPTWGPTGSCRPQMGPMLAPWTLLSGMFRHWIGVDSSRGDKLGQQEGIRYNDEMIYIYMAPLGLFKQSYHLDSYVLLLVRDYLTWLSSGDKADCCHQNILHNVKKTFWFCPICRVQSVFVIRWIFNVYLSFSI